MLSSGAELDTYKTWFGNKENDNLFIKVSKSPQKPDLLDTVIKIEMKKQKSLEYEFESR